MGRNFIGNETVKIEFPDGEWVDIKEELTQADQDFMLNQMAKAENIGGKAEVSMSLGRLALLECGVVAWSFVDDGKPVPVSKEAISHLRTKYRGKLLEEMNRLYEAAAEFVVKNG